MEMSAVADHSGEACAALDEVVDGEVVEQRTKEATAGSALDDDLVGGRFVHEPTMRFGRVSAPHPIRHLTRVTAWL